MFSNIKSTNLPSLVLRWLQYGGDYGLIMMLIDKVRLFTKTNFLHVSGSNFNEFFAA